MPMPRAFALLLMTLPACAAAAPRCDLPSASHMPQRPALQPAHHDQLARTVTRTIDVPVERFRDWFFRAPLERILTGTPRIPAVTGTARVGTLEFPTAGSVRYVCLADGNGALEQVLDDAPQRFRYVVWAYTSPAAQALEYGHGEFVIAPSATGRTALRWTYSFRLKDDRFPGMLGGLGRFLFRRSFLDGPYAEFMEAGMQAIQHLAETEAKPLSGAPAPAAADSPPRLAPAPSGA